MNSSYVKWIKAAVGLVVLVVLLMVVSRYWGDFRAANARNASVATSTAAPGKDSKDASESQATKGATLVVLTDGLNLREEPDRTANAIRGLKKGERITLLKKGDGWYQVQDRKKVKGWVSSSPSYTKVAK